MSTKNTNPATEFANRNLSPLLMVFYEINHLKQIYRKGWLKKIPSEYGESVADHTFGVAMMAWLIATEFFPELDHHKVLRLALIHDIAEVYAGDITPGDGISAEKKQKIEREAVKEIFSKLPNGEHYVALWEEFELEQSPEAKFVKQIDRLEMGLQAGIYEHQHDVDMQEFFDSVESAISLPRLKELLNQIRQ